MSRKRSRTSSESEYEYSSDEDESVEVPNPDNSGSSDDSDSDDDAVEELAVTTYHRAKKNYRVDQTKLEKDHVFQWVDGEKIYSNEYENEILLSDRVKRKIRESEPIQLFETFFSTEIKEYIIDACRENGFTLEMNDLNTFIGIVMLTSFKPRKSQRDYWSTDPYFSCPVVSSAMSRDNFETIKKNLKYAKVTDNDSNDKAWRVRQIMKIFQKNILSFGIWRSALSIDEMMAKSYARTSMKQFIRGKPVRFGLKFWGLCTADGYLLNFDLYCGKNSPVCDKLGKCALGSRVVLNLLEPFFAKIAAGKISLYHLYFDNFFTNLDLVVHLNKLRLKCTGTIRENRVREKNIINKKSQRGTYTVKHDVNSGMNYVTVMDSKLVSVVSTAAGVTPSLPTKRYCSNEKTKIDVQFPQAFHLYNRFMGGVDCMMDTVITSC